MTQSYGFRLGVSSDLLPKDSLFRAIVQGLSTEAAELEPISDKKPLTDQPKFTADEMLDWLSEKGREMATNSHRFNYETGDYLVPDPDDIWNVGTNREGWHRGQSLREAITAAMLQSGLKPKEQVTITWRECPL